MRVGRENCTRPRAWYREPYAWLVVLIPASAVLMALVMIPLAVSTFDGLVVDDYYEQGLEINRTLTRDRAAARVELRADVAFDAGSASVILHASDAFAPPRAVRLQLFHATRDGLDRELVLRRQGVRGYVGAGADLEAGRWHVQVEADDWRLLGSVIASSHNRVALSYRTDL